MVPNDPCHAKSRRYLQSEPSLRPMPVAQQAGPKTTLVNYRATASEAQQLKQWAAEQDQTLSDLLRRGLQLQGFQPQED